tara:strand:+ start:100 stop:447 length:348 start_codon:yes stop_codon:yes gene_type:complete
MAHGLHNLTVVEAQNLQLGQGKTAHLDSTNAFTNISSGNVVVAIQVIQDCTFASLVAEDPHTCIGTGSDNDNSHDPGETGDKVNTSTTFVAGLVLYGRWTTVDLANGVVNLYLSK